MLQVVETSSYELEHPKECGGQVFERFPEVWREQFWDLAWRCVEISNAISMASSLCSRYQEQVGYSRDAYEHED